MQRCRARRERVKAEACTGGAGELHRQVDHDFHGFTGSHDSFKTSGDSSCRPPPADSGFMGRFRQQIFLFAVKLREDSRSMGRPGWARSRARDGRATPPVQREVQQEGAGRVDHLTAPARRPASSSARAVERPSPVRAHQADPGRRSLRCRMRTSGAASGPRGRAEARSCRSPSGWPA